MSIGSPRIRYRRERRDDPAKWKVHFSQEWIDPYPWIAGTMPEKMVFAELAKRHVPFIYQADWYEDVTINFAPELRDVSLNQDQFVPDLLLPNLKVVIEVQGSYWHADPLVRAHDVKKKGFYSAYGYTTIEMWDFDIIRNVQAEVDRIPGIQGAKPGEPKLGSHLGLGAGTVAAGNKARARPAPIGLKRRVLRGRRRLSPSRY